MTTQISYFGTFLTEACAKTQKKKTFGF